MKDVTASPPLVWKETEFVMGSYETQFDALDTATRAEAVKTDVLIIPVFQKDAGSTGSGKARSRSKAKSNVDDEDDKPSFDWTSPLEAINKAMGGHLKATLEAEKFKAAANKTRVFYLRPGDGLKARWLILVGLGSQDKLDMKKAISVFNSAFKNTFRFKDANHHVVSLPKATEKLSAKDWGNAVVFGSLQSTYKTAEAGEKKIPKLKYVHIIPPAGSRLSTPDLEQAAIIGQAEAWTKDLANQPANIKTAQTLADAARSLIGLPGISVDVIANVKQIEQEFPAFWAVAQGSAASDPPRFITVRYKPPGKAKPKKKIALVGKGVIFDTGGVQVKTGNFMNDMKFDMTGAATVLAVIKAAAQLKLTSIEITAYVAATRNAISDTAYLPDSIINSASGKRIEIRHTDAEGRVTLADAVWKASQDKPDELITVATLTGSASNAVGHSIALMGTSDPLLDRLVQTAKAMGDRIQALELFEEDFETIKSDRDAADFSNTAKAKTRGHMSAGAFVISFADEGIACAHMDIAGGDAKDGNATGIAVKGLIEYLKLESARM